MRTLCLMLMLCVGTATADEKSDREQRERKAKVALALAGQKPAPSAAPAPRAAVPSYSVGYAKAVESNKPLVVFVNCQSWPVEGAVVTRTAGPFAGETGPAVVVGFPVGEKLLIDATCTPDRAKVAEAVKSAQRKIDVPTKDMVKPAAPRPLKWDL